MNALPVDPHLFLTFLGVMAVLAVTPGPANLFSIANGITRGPAAVPIAVAGMSAATLVWFAAAALGLSALVAAFPEAFRLIAVLGAVYVAWLGISAIRGAFRSQPEMEKPTLRPSRGAFAEGFLVQIANPKAILFFTAILPPFIDASRPTTPQFAVFAVAAVGLDMIGMSAYGFGGAAMARWMTRPGFRRGFGLFTGALLLSAAGLILSRL